MTTDTLQESSNCTRTLAPPPALQRFVPLPAEGPGDWPAYTEHPAYAQFMRTATLSMRVRASLTFLRYFFLILAKRLISYELIPVHIRAAGGLRFIRFAMSHAWQKVAGVPLPAPLAAGSATEQALVRDGICVASIAATHFAPIETAAQPLLQTLRNTRGTSASEGRDFIESRAVALRTASADLYEAIDSMLISSGIIDGISRYIGRPAKLVDVNPQINDASDDFWRRTFPDLPPEPRPASYFHRDASGGDIKAILYLSDVGADHGPFSFVIGSHRARQSKLTDWVEETVDQAGLSGTDRDSRRYFAALPRALRRKCAFGNDLRVSQPVTQRMLGAEWVVTAPQGHIVIFDTKGFHRGGMVTQGERVVLTCVIGSARRGPAASAR